MFIEILIILAIIQVVWYVIGNALFFEVLDLEPPETKRQNIIYYLFVGPLFWLLKAWEKMCNCFKNFYNNK